MAKYLVSGYILFFFTLSGVSLPCSAQTQTTNSTSTATVSSSAAQQSPQLAELSKLNTSVATAYSQKQYDEALRDGKRALRIGEKALPDDHPQLIVAVTNLAMVHLAKQNYGEAKSLLQRSLSTLEKKHGAESAQLLTVLDRLSIVSFNSGDRGKAESLALRALAIREKAYGLNSLEVYKSLTFIADLYQTKGDYPEAERFLLRLIQAKEQETGAAREGLKEARGKYIGVLYQSGRRQEADDYLAELQKNSATSSDAPELVQGGVLNGRATYKAVPAYPQEAKSLRAQGTVSVNVIIDETGKVTSAQATNGPPSLRGAAIDAARFWRFTPTLLDSRPVQVSGTIIFTFTLQ